MEDRKILNLEVNAGLCNRLRALVAGICWAEKMDRKLVVHWTSSKPECAAGFYDLFGLSSLPDFVKVIYVNLPSADTCLQASDAWRIFTEKQHDPIINIKSHGNFWDGERSIYLAHLRRLRPSNEVQRLLDIWDQNDLNSTTTAFHIRMTDNEKAIRLSPVELFIKKLFTHEGPVVVFSDEPTSVNALEMNFGKKILSFERLRQRNTLGGMIEGTAVFFALAAKKQIFGSANSSFSEIASEYGGSELIILRRD